MLRTPKIPHTMAATASAPVTASNAPRARRPIFPAVVFIASPPIPSSAAARTTRPERDRSALQRAATPRMIPDWLAAAGLPQANRFKRGSGASNGRAVEADPWRCGGDVARGVLPDDTGRARCRRPDRRSLVCLGHNPLLNSSDSDRSLGPDTSASIANPAERGSAYGRGRRGRPRRPASLAPFGPSLLSGLDRDLGEPLLSKIA